MRSVNCLYTQSRVPISLCAAIGPTPHMVVCACTTSNTNPLHYCQLAPHTHNLNMCLVYVTYTIMSKTIIRLHYKMDEKYFERERESTVVLVEMRIV